MKEKLSNTGRIGNLGLLSVIGLLVLIYAFIAGNLLYEDVASSVVEEIPSAPSSYFSMDLGQGGKTLSLSFDATDNGYIDIIYVDIVDTVEGEHYGHGEITFDDTSRVINLLEIERGGDIYSIKVLYRLNRWLNSTTLYVGESKKITFDADGGDIWMGVCGDTQRVLHKC